MTATNLTTIGIHQYSRWKSADGKRNFIVLGKWCKGTEVVSYDVLEPEVEQMRVIDAKTWEAQITEGKLVRILAN